MKPRIRSKPRLKRLLLSTTLPAASLGLLSLSGSAFAQEEAENVALAAEMSAQNTSPATGPQDAAKPQTQPTPQAGPVIGEFVVIGNKTLSSEAIIALSRHKVGD